MSGDAIATVATSDLIISEQGVVDGTSPFVVQGSRGGPAAGSGRRRSRTVLVPRDAKGVTIEPSPCGIGLQAAALADVRFQGVTGAILGEAKAGPHRHDARDGGVSGFRRMCRDRDNGQLRERATRVRSSRSPPSRIRATCSPQLAPMSTPGGHSSMPAFANTSPDG